MCLCLTKFEKQRKALEKTWQIVLYSTKIGNLWNTLQPKLKIFKNFNTKLNCRRKFGQKLIIIVTLKRQKPREKLWICIFTRQNFKMANIFQSKDNTKNYFMTKLNDRLWWEVWNLILFDGIWNMAKSKMNKITFLEKNLKRTRLSE